MHAISGTLQQKLRKVRPHYVLVFLRDEEEPKRVNVQTTSTIRTKLVLETVRDLDWVKVEMYDAKGGLLGTHARSSDDELPATGLEELGGSGLAQSNKMSDLAAFALILTKANDQVSERQVRLIAPLLDAFVSVVNVTVRRLDATNESLDVERERVAAAQTARERELIKQLREAVENQGTGEEGADSPDMLTSLMPLIMSALAKPAPAAVVSTGASSAAAAAGASTASTPAPKNANAKRKVG